MGSREWRSAAVGVALAVGLVVPVAGPAPAGAAETTFDDTCADVYGHRPVGNLDKVTDPVAGSSVAEGQTVSVTLQWPNSMVAGTRAHRLLECVSVDGDEPQLWAERSFSTDQGTVTLSVKVPAGLPDKSIVCSQSFLKTQGAFGPVTRWSEKTCFPVGAAGTFTALARSPSPSAESRPDRDSASTPTTRGPLFKAPPSESARPPSWSRPPRSSGSDYRSPWPPWEEAPKVATPVTTPTTRAAAATTTTVRKAQGTQAAAPATQAPAQAPSQTLPRTGAGLVVLMAIAAVALFSGRTLRKTADRIEDSLPVEAVPVDDDAEPTLVLGRQWSSGPRR